MPTPPKRQSAASKAISLRLSEDDRGLIDTAAVVARKSRTDFMVESSLKAAVETLLDARAFQLDEEQSRALTELLTNPPAPVDKLRKLMASRAAWE